jgi:glutaminyl-tRNA synthetase
VRDDLKERVPSRNAMFGPVKVIITNDPEGQSEECEIENNPAVPEMGSRKVTFSREIWVDRADFMEIPEKKYFRLYPGNEVRLKGAYFVTCNEVVKDENGKVVELLCTYDPDTKSGTPGADARKVKGTIHWVCEDDCVDIPVRQYGLLALPDAETGRNEFNPDSKTELTAKAEGCLRDAKAGERFQFFRNGYYIADTVLSKEGAPVFNQIVGLKSSYKKG